MYNEKYKVLCKLGWGQYSTVWLVRNQATGTVAAMKIQKSSTSYMEAAQDELSFCQAIERKRQETRNFDAPVVALLDHFIFAGQNGKHMCFVYELLGSSLLDLIKHYDYKGIPVDVVKPLFKNVRCRRRCAVVGRTALTFRLPCGDAVTATTTNRACSPHD